MTTTTPMTGRQLQAQDDLDLLDSTDDPYDHSYPYGVTYRDDGTRVSRWFVSKQDRARFRVLLAIRRDGFAG